MGVKLLESLEMQTGLPLDSRDIVANIDQRNNIESSVRYIGMEVYVSEENKKYRLEEGIENFNWKEIKAIANASELITDDNHLTVSKAEKETWSGKADSNHNHNGIYQPVGNYAAASHTHTASDVGTYTSSEIDNKRIETSNGVIGGNTLGKGVNIQLEYASNEDVLSSLGENIVKDIVTLAKEQDIRNLFVGTVLEGGKTYNLSTLSEDETKVVNMRLLSLYNDLIIQKTIELMESKDTASSDALKVLINNKANSSINITAGTGLAGGGSLNNNINLSLDFGSDTDIKNILK